MAVRAYGEEVIEGEEGLAPGLHERSALNLVQDRARAVTSPVREFLDFFSQKAISNRIEWVRMILFLLFNQNLELPDCVKSSREDLEEGKETYGMVAISGIPSPGPFNVGKSGHCLLAPSLETIAARLRDLHGEEAAQIFLQKYDWAMEVPHPTRGEKGYEDITAIYGYHKTYEDDPEYRGKVVGGAVKRILTALETADTVFILAHSYGNNVTLDALNDERIQLPEGKRIILISLAPAFDHLWRNVSRVCPHRHNGEIASMVKKIGAENIFVIRTKGDPLSGLPDDFPVTTEELLPDLCIDPTFGAIGHLTVMFRKGMRMRLEGFLRKVLQK